jgi:hypothetical protein
MKKILLLLICLPLLFSCNSKNNSFEERINNAKKNRERIGKIINQRVNEIKPKLPIDFENGVIWEDVFNEYDVSQVFVYSVSYDGIDIVMNYISKNQMIEDMKAANAYKLSVKHGINSVYRYYHNGNLIKEIKIEPQDFK